MALLVQQQQHSIGKKKKNDPSGFYGCADDQIESTTQLNWSIVQRVAINTAGNTISKEK